jgi:hypothetical protein
VRYGIRHPAGTAAGSRRRELADVADRAAADQLGERENLGHGQHRPLGRVLITGPANTARVPSQDLVLFHGRHEHRPQQSVRLGRHRDGHATGEQLRPPLADHGRGQSGDRHAAQVRRDVLAEQPAVQVDSAGPQLRAFRDPRRGVVSQFDLATLRVGPLARAHLRLNQHERLVCVGLAFVCIGASAYPPVRAGIPDLETPRRQPSDVAEPPVPIRYADDFAVLTDGTEQDMQALREQIAHVLAALGLRFSEAKTRVVHMSEGFSFLGFRIQWRRKQGTAKWYVYTFIDDRPVRSLKAKIRALTRRTSQLDLGYVLTRLNQVMHGWASYFRHAVAKNTFGMLDNLAWRRVISMLRTRHRWRWKDVRRQLTTPDGRWRPITAGQTELRRIAATPVTRYCYRGNTIPNPWAVATT